MSERQTIAGLDVAAPIAEFVEQTLAPTTIAAADFWRGFAEIVADLTPRNRELVDRRAQIQRRIDDFHAATPGQPDPVAYRALLEEIGYLVPEPDRIAVSTDRVDAEIARLAGPQLVVPVLNARYAVNAANARWGSLYDALYGTDVIAQDGELAVGAEYNPVRGREVIARGRAFLDETVALTTGSHADVTAYRIADGALEAQLTGGAVARLADPAALAGYTGAPEAPDRVLFTHHGLHIEIVVDRAGAIGRDDAAGIQDIVIESAVTTIMDLEDSVAAVDAEDKALGYRNWRDLMAGTLTAQVSKGGRTFTRAMNPDRDYSDPRGRSFSLPGRSLLLVRNVGHLMTTDAVRDASGEEVFEGILDAAMTALGSLSDLHGTGRLANSRTGSMYIVKPKMHGPDEVAFAVELLARVERLLGLPETTLKIGIMDEERRTTLNLRACIARAADRVVFINTGFLDRTGDEIHTSLRAGAMVPKAAMRAQPFLSAYENANVDAGLAAGFSGRAQIGKGMWAMPDLMLAMVEQKGAQVEAGANTAWVPSPTAATLHALHYHRVDVFAVHRELAGRPSEGIEPLLSIPLADDLEPVPSDPTPELDNNVQSILGYVVRWIDQGIGCSKVPDLHGVALMEDRATLRISSQLLANWLHHGVITVEQVDDSLERMSKVVDEQNAGDPAYEPLIGPEGPGLAFQAARALIVEGAEQPNGYTEPLLHGYRRRKKAQLAHAAATSGP